MSPTGGAQYELATVRKPAVMNGTKSFDIEEAGNSMSLLADFMRFTTPGRTMLALMLFRVFLVH